MKYRWKKTVKKGSEPLPRGAKSRVEFLSSEPIDKKHLKAAISLLTHSCNEKRGPPRAEHCIHRVNECDTKKRSQKCGISLKAHEAGYMTGLVRDSLLLGDWDTAARLIMMVLSTGTKHHTIVVARACMTILTNHPNSSDELLTDFLRHVTNYKSDEDMAKFAILLGSLRESLLRPVPTNKMHVQQIPIIHNTAFTDIELNDLSLGKD